MRGGGGRGEKGKRPGWKRRSRTDKIVKNFQKKVVHIGLFADIFTTKLLKEHVVKFSFKSLFITSSTCLHVLQMKGFVIYRGSNKNVSYVPELYKRAFCKHFPLPKITLTSVLN